MTIKRAIKRTSNWTAVLSHFLSAAASEKTRACIFYYHRIADVDFIDPSIDDHNVSPKAFEQQLEALCRIAEIVPVTKISSDAVRHSGMARPLVSLTFDDGFANFYTRALPILKKYNAPATLSVVTSTINERTPMRFDKWGQKNYRRAEMAAWRPISWDEIEKCLASGLVTLGAHSHEHRRASECRADQIAEEVERSAEILRTRFGRENVPFFAYPYGNTHLGHVPEVYENAVRRAGFQIAATTDFGAVSEMANPFRLPRIEAHALDTAAVLQAKIDGRFSPFRFYDFCRAAKFKLAARFNSFPARGRRTEADV